MRVYVELVSFHISIYGFSSLARSARSLRIISAYTIRRMMRIGGLQTLFIGSVTTMGVSQSVYANQFLIFPDLAQILFSWHPWELSLAFFVRLRYCSAAQRSTPASSGALQCVSSF